MGGDQLRRRRPRRGTEQHRQADVVDAFEHDHVGDAGLREHVPVQPRLGAHAEKVAPDLIAGNAEVHHGGVLVAVGMQVVGAQDVLGEKVGVAGVQVHWLRLGLVAVGDGITQRRDHRHGTVPADVYGGQVEPGRHCGRHLEVHRRGLVAVRQVVGLQRPYVIAHGRFGHGDVIRQMQADDQVRQVWRKEVNRIADHPRAGRNGHRGLAPEGQLPVAAGADRRIGVPPGQARLAHVQRRGAEFIGQPHPELRAAHADANDLTDGGVVDGRQGRIERRDGLGGRCPGRRPVLGIGSHGAREGHRQQRQPRQERPAGHPPAPPAHGISFFSNH